MPKGVQEEIRKLEEEENRLVIADFVAKARQVKCYYVFEVKDAKGFTHVFSTRPAAIKFANSQKPISNVDETELNEDELQGHVEEGMVHLE